MQDHQLYQQLLGLSPPWRVSRVELKLKEGEVAVHLGHDPDARWECPECGKECPMHDHAAERVWRHLDTCQYRTLVHASVPRVRCLDHGVLVSQVAWAEKHSRFTMLFERLVIDWLRVASQMGVARRLGLTWDQVSHIMKRGKARAVAAPGEGGVLYRRG